MQITKTELNLLVQEAILFKHIEQHLAEEALKYEGLVEEGLFDKLKEGLSSVAGNIKKTLDQPGVRWVIAKAIDELSDSSTIGIDKIKDGTLAKNIMETAEPAATKKAAVKTVDELLNNSSNGKMTTNVILGIYKVYERVVRELKDADEKKIKKEFGIRMDRMLSMGM